jgi:hypothetical protein
MKTLTAVEIKEYAKDVNTILRTVIREDENAPLMMIEIVHIEAHGYVLINATGEYRIIGEELIDSMADDISHWNIYDLREECKNVLEDEAGTNEDVVESTEEVESEVPYFDEATEAVD